MVDNADTQDNQYAQSTGNLSVDLSARSSLSPEATWQAVRGQLQISMPKATFDTWVRDTDFVSYSDDFFTIGVQNGYARDWLESRLTTMVSRLLTGITGHSCEVRFVVSQDIGETVENDAQIVARKLQLAFATTIASVKSQISLSDYEQHIKHLRLEQHQVNGTSCTIISPDRESILWINSYIRPQFETLFRTSYGEEIHLRFEAISPDDPLRGASIDDNLELYTPLVRLRDVFFREEVGHRFPRYLLRWLPSIGTNAFWTLIALRQAHFFQYHCLPENGNRIQVSLRDLAAIIGGDKNLIQSHRDSGVLAPFIEHFPTEKYTVVQPGKVHRSAHEYAFRNTVPFVPADIQSLTAFLLSKGFNEKPFAALDQALKTNPRDLLSADLSPSEEIKFQTAVPLQKHLLALCKIELSTTQRANALRKIEQLQSHIIEGLGHEFVTLYFLKHWLPRLGHAGAVFVLLCRQKTYVNQDDGEYREFWQLSNGLASLQPIAMQMGRSLKTVKRFVPNIEHEGRKAPGRRRKHKQTPKNNAHSEWLQKHKREMANFIFRAVKKPNGPLRLYVTRVDPLIALHQHEYDAALLIVAHFLGSYGLDYSEEDVNHYMALLAAEGLISNNNKSQKEDNSKPQNQDNSKSQDQDIHISQKEDNSKPQNQDNGISQDQDIYISQKQDIFLKTLNIPSFTFLTANRLRNYLMNQQQTNQIASPETPSIEWTKAVGAEWKKEHIDKCRLFTHSERRELENKKAHAQDIIAWILYCYSVKGEGIKRPNKFIITRFSDNETENPSVGFGFEYLARLGPAKLQKLLRNLESTSQGLQFKGDLPGRDEWNRLMAPLPDQQAYVDLVETLGLGKRVSPHPSA